MRTAPNFGILALCAIGAHPQAAVSVRAGLIDVTIGEVYRDSEMVRATANQFLSLNDGQVLRTGAGRIEMLLAPAVFLRLGAHASLRMRDSSLTDTRVELEHGTALVEVVETVKSGRIRLICGDTQTELHASGLYRFDSDAGELRVFGGEARVAADEQQVAAGRGRTVKLDRSLSLSTFKRSGADALHRWAAYRSFRLFVSSAGARARRTDWEYTVTGWLWNRNFQMRFFSPQAVAEHRLKRSAASQERAGFDPIESTQP